MITTIKTIGENRLIFRKASDFSYTGPKINTRNAEINATNQETERAKSLLAQQAAAAKAAGSNPLMYDGSYTGSAAVNPLDAMAKRSIQELNPTENLDENQGVFNASAIKRLRASGMSDSDIKKRLNGLKPSIKETMSNTGLNTPLPDAYLKENNAALPFGGSIVSSQVGANGNPEYILSNGLRVSASAYDQERVNASTQARNNAKISGTVNGEMTTTTPGKTLKVVSYVDNPDGTTTNTLSDGTTSTVRYTKNPDGSLTPTEVMPSIPSNVPDEYKPFIDYYLQQGGSTERINAARNAAQVAADGADEIAKQEAASAKVQIENNEANLAEQERIIEENKLKNEKLLDEQKKIAEEQLALEEARVMYNQQQEKKDTLRKMTNALAVSGGFNSGNGLAYIESTSQKLTDHIDTISKEYGLEKRKLLSNFKASYLQIEQNADNNMEIARQNYLAEAKAINSFTLQSKANATNSKVAAIKNFSDKVDDILKDREIAVGKAIDLSIGMIKDEKENKRVSQEQAFNDLKWYKSNYGANLPEGVATELQNKLPNLNVSSFLTTETLAEKKAKAAKVSAARVSGAWAATFRPTELKSDGSIPNFDEYLAQRKQDEGFYKQNTGGVAGPQNMLETQLGLPTQASEKLFRSRIQKEYDAKVAEKQKYSIKNIDTLLAVANSSTNVPAHTKKDRVAEVNKQINSGDYVAAYDYVAGLGSQPSSTERETLSKAINARENVKKIKEKFAALGPNIGPVYGRARELNPYDTDIVEIQALIKGTVPGVARGIFGEVGVLTNEDVENYTQVMANPRLTAEQAMLLTDNLLETIDHTVKSKLDIWTAAGVSTKRLYELYESGATKEQVQQSGIDPISSYTQSLLQ